MEKSSVDMSSQIAKLVFLNNYRYHFQAIKANAWKIECPCDYINKCILNLNSVAQFSLIDEDEHKPYQCGRCLEFVNSEFFKVYLSGHLVETFCSFCDFTLVHLGVQFDPLYFENKTLQFIFNSRTHITVTTNSPYSVLDALTLSDRLGYVWNRTRDHLFRETRR